MNVRAISFGPTKEYQELGRESLTPELFASIGARYSRNNEGYDAIVDKIKGMDPDKAVDVIFKMIDYGHASIGDMVPVALLLEDISLIAAYRLWSLSPQGSGQESSTRYIQMSKDSVVKHPCLSSKGNDEPLWEEFISGSFSLYEEGLKYWGDILEKHPELLKIPEDAKPAVKERMKRNYIFDRARYALPAACKTNMVLYQSARSWVEVIKWLLSFSEIREEHELAQLIRKELEVLAPRMLKHAEVEKSVHHKKVLQTDDKIEEFYHTNRQNKYRPFLEINESSITCKYKSTLVESLKGRTNRYSPFGSTINMMTVTYGWNSIPFAEIRDLNRHRTGNKICGEIPVDVYTAADQSPTPDDGYLVRLHSFLDNWAQFARNEFLNGHDLNYLYWTSLGTCYSFYHSTTADKFLYTAELRTGLGAHYKYCQCFKDVLELWYKEYPESRGLLFEGTGEPE